MLETIKINIPLLTWVIVMLALFTLLVCVMRVMLKEGLEIVRILKKIKPVQVETETLTEWLKENTIEIKIKSTKGDKNGKQES